MCSHALQLLCVVVAVEGSVLTRIATAVCGRLVKQVYEGDVVGKRPRGRPRKRWDDNFK